MLPARYRAHLSVVSAKQPRRGSIRLHRRLPLFEIRVGTGTGTEEHPGEKQAAYPTGSNIQGHALQSIRSMKYGGTAASTIPKGTGRLEGENKWACRIRAKRRLVTMQSCLCQLDVPVSNDGIGVQ